MDEKKPKITINVLYLHCNDIHSIRHFYKDIIGLGDEKIGDPEKLYCGQTSDGITMMWAKSEYVSLPLRKPWADIPGTDFGSIEEASWGIQYPEDLFRETVRKLMAEKTPAVFEKPRFISDSYWSYPVSDPMGYTVEVFCVPEKTPERKEWE